MRQGNYSHQTGGRATETNVEGQTTLPTQQRSKAGKLMFRLYDWKCRKCGSVQESVVQFKTGEAPPSQTLLPCEVCGDRYHNRLPPRTVAHVGRRFAPLVAGGSFDTAGKKSLTPLPQIPEGASDNYSAMKDFFNTKEYKEVKAHRKEEKRRNQQKQVRADLVRKGESIDIRRFKLPGDPQHID